jgi:hypothetical protein
MNPYESIRYELAPYFYLCTGLSCIVSSNKVAGVFGALLLITALLVIRMRIAYRKANRVRRQTATRRRSQLANATHWR